MVAPQPYFSARGTPFSVMHRIRALLNHGHDIDLLTYGYGENLEFPTSKGNFNIIRSKRIAGINSVKIGPSIAKLLLDVILYFDTKKALERKSYDLVHSHEEASFWVMPLCKKNSIPHLYDMHSSLPQQLSNFKAFNLKPFRMIFNRLENKVLDNCDGVITICKDLEKIVKQVVPNKPHSMIENIGDDRKVFRPSEENITEIFKLQNLKVVLYTGTFEAYQGIDLLLESLQIICKKDKGIAVMLVGGRKNQIEHYRTLAKKLGVYEFVRFSGTVHPSRIPNFIDASDVIVSPRSRGTNTPLKIYNYLRTGIPIVATNRLTHTQTLNTNICCLVEPTPTSFAEGILTTLNDPIYAQKIAKNAVKFSEQYFSDKHYIEMVNSIVQQTLQAFNKRIQVKKDENSAVTNLP